MNGIKIINKLNIMKILLIITISYIVPVLLSWWWFHLAYSKNGIRSDSNPEIIDVFLSFMPIFNWICIYAWIEDYPVKRKEKKQIGLINFLELKNNSNTIK